MAPVRRYLRISKYSVLECRIYVDNPALVDSWLLNPRDPVLPHVIASVRPLVLPKLHEERERSRKKSTKKKAIKDIVTEDDFEVSIFLTETNTRHTLLTKHKHFHENAPSRLKSNTNKLISETDEGNVGVGGANDPVPILLEEDSDDNHVPLANIPLAPDSRPTRAKRPRQVDDPDNDPDTHEGFNETASAILVDSDTQDPPFKRLREDGNSDGENQNEDGDDKKKLAMDVSYEGFSIYGRVLCLVVHKRDAGSKSSGRGRGRGKVTADISGQASMDNWIASTQVPVGGDVG